MANGYYSLRSSPPFLSSSNRVVTRFPDLLDLQQGLTSTPLSPAPRFFPLRILPPLLLFLPDQQLDEEDGRLCFLHLLHVQRFASPFLSFLLLSSCHLSKSDSVSSPLSPPRLEASPPRRRSSTSHLRSHPLLLRESQQLPDRRPLGVLRRKLGYRHPSGLHDLHRHRLRRQHDSPHRRCDPVHPSPMLHPRKLEGESRSIFVRGRGIETDSTFYRFSRSTAATRSTRFVASSPSRREARRLPLPLLPPTSLSDEPRLFSSTSFFPLANRRAHQAKATSENRSKRRHGETTSSQERNSCSWRTGKLRSPTHAAERLSRRGG